MYSVYLVEQIERI